MNDELIFSRPLATALRLGADALDKHIFPEKKVLLIGESNVLATENGKNCFVSSMLLLFRICKNLSILIPNQYDDLFNECHLILEKTPHPSNIRFLKDEVNYRDYDAILNIGQTARPDLPWTVINSNGWVIRVSSGTKNIQDVCDQANPIATLAAASLGATEVFKRLINLKEGRGKLLDGLVFSLYSYESVENDYGPSLPIDIPIHLLVVGVGAIGNGVIYLLNLLPVSGDISIVDTQKFQPENLGTCILIGQSEIGVEKADFAKQYLSGHLTVNRYVGDIQEISKRLGKEIPYPKAIINGLDNIDARHAVQDLWPDIVIDGAIGDFMCQASRHPWGEDIACLKCLFRETKVESSDEISSKATGLTIGRVKNELEMVTEEDVKLAPITKKDWLRKNIGKQICSVIQEGVAREISNTKQQEGFEPSVPFVACFSASMVISEFVKFILNFSSPLEPRFQFDILRGPALGQKIPQERRRDCICFIRKTNIDIVRQNQTRYLSALENFVDFFGF